MISIAALTIPAMPHRDHDIDHLEAEEPLAAAPVSRVTIRFWVSAECRKITCGMTVAPRMPTASSTLSVPSNCGVTACVPIAPQSGLPRKRLDQVADRDHADHAR